jgi:hypothetical protein
MSSKFFIIAFALRRTFSMRLYPVKLISLACLEFAQLYRPQ